MKGAIEQDFLETFTRPDGSTFIYTHEIQFDRPVIQELDVTVTATRLDTLVPLDIALIKEKIAEKEYRIGADSYASELYAFGYQAGTNFYLEAMLVDTFEIVDGIPGTKFNIDVANITVTEVP